MRSETVVGRYTISIYRKKLHNFFTDVNIKILVAKEVSTVLYYASLMLLFLQLWIQVCTICVINNICQQLFYSFSINVVQFTCILWTTQLNFCKGSSVQSRLILQDVNLQLQLLHTSHNSWAGTCFLTWGNWKHKNSSYRSGA